MARPNYAFSLASERKARDKAVTGSCHALKAVDDVLNEIDVFTKECNDWLAGSEFDFAERYINRNLHLSIRWLSGTANDQHDVFVQRLMARDGDEILPASPLQTKSMDIPAHPTDDNEPVVFIDIAKSIEAPKQVISSSIWFERANGSLIGGRKLFYFSLNDWLFKFRCIPSEWKVNTFCVGRSIRSGGRTSENIQRRAQLAQRISNHNCSLIWDGTLKSELHFIAGAIGITLTEDAVGIAFNEGSNLRGNLIDVFLGPGNLQPWRNEKFIHAGR